MVLYSTIQQHWHVDWAFQNILACPSFDYMVRFVDLTFQMIDFVVLLVMGETPPLFTANGAADMDI